MPRGDAEQRQDCFGQTVNIASRVQDLADAQAILATETVVVDQRASAILASSGIASVKRPAELRGIAHDVSVYALP
jgi:class 3 adenylate cyclase